MMERKARSEKAAETSNTSQAGRLSGASDDESENTHASQANLDHPESLADPCRIEDTAEAAEEIEDGGWLCL